MDPVILIHETQGLPEELIGVRPIWEVHEGPVGSDASNTSRRLYPDGRLFALGRRELVITREHKPKARLGKREWRLAAVVGDVQGVEAAIKEYFLRIPTQDPDHPVVLDGTDLTWTAILSDGARHRVTRAGDAPHGVMEVERAIARRILRGAVQVPHLAE